MPRILAVLFGTTILAGCSPLDNRLGLTIVLVLVPAAILVGALWLARRARGDREPGRGPRYPDYRDDD